MKAYLCLGSALFLAVAAGACSSSSSDPAPVGPAGTPTIKITSPADKAAVTLAATETDVPITFTTSLTLKDPGKCAGAANCGHIHVVVDGTACNSPGLPYNEAATSSPTMAGLDYCKAGIPGSHKIVLELHNDDHSPIKDSSNATISDTVTITASGGAPADAGADSGGGDSGGGDAATDGG